MDGSFLKKAGAQSRLSVAGGLEVPRASDARNLRLGAALAP